LTTNENELVRHANSSQPAAACRESAVGESEMYEPEGNDGERIRMYHPRLGRWMTQRREVFSS
jgi:hypothetical protein